MQTTLRLETHYWWPAFERRAEESQILTTGELLVRLAQEEDDIAIVLEPGRAPKGQVVEQADHPDHGSRWDVAFTGLVVEADVAAHDGQLEGAAGIGEASDALLQLAEDLRPLRITEVQAVGDRDRPGPGADDVAGCLRHRGPGALVRVQRDVARIAVGGQRQALVGRGHPEQGGVETWADHRVVLHLVIVGAIDGAAASQVRAADQVQQDGFRFLDQWHHRRRPLLRKGGRRRPEGNAVDQGLQRHVRDYDAVFAHPHPSRASDRPDSIRVQLVVIKDFARRCLRLRPHDDQHSFL